MILFVFIERRGRQGIYLYTYPLNPPPAKVMPPYSSGNCTRAQRYWRRYAVLRQPRGDGCAAEGSIRQARDCPKRPTAADLLVMSEWDRDTKRTNGLGRIGSGNLDVSVTGRWLGKVSLIHWERSVRASRATQDGTWKRMIFSCFRRPLSTTCRGNATIRLKSLSRRH